MLHYLVLASEKATRSQDQEVRCIGPKIRLG